MDIFKDLRNAAYRVEHKVNNAKQLASQKRPSSDDDHSHESALLLMHKEKEAVRNMRFEVSKLQKSLHEVSFLDVVSTCEDLMKEQQRILEETEAHLEQYGYCPPKLETSTESQLPSDDDDVKSSVSTEEANPKVEVDPATPKNVQKSPEDLDRTPQMSDFGISEITMKLWASSARSTFKVPEVPSDTQPRVSQLSWNSENIPDDFKHEGLLVTPGIMLKQMSDKTPNDLGAWCFDKDAPLKDQSVQPLRLASDSSEEGQSPRQPNYCDSSPIPPVLCTPGIRQIKPTSRLRTPTPPPLTQDTPEPPIFTSPTLNLLMSQSKIMARVTHTTPPPANTTPVPPVLQTPGLKQIKSLALRANELELTTKLSDDVSDTPELPQLSQFYSHTNSDAPSQSEPEDTQPESDSTFLSQRQNLVSFEDVCRSPREQDVDSSFCAANGATHVSSSSLSPPGTPVMPELTGSYNFNLRSFTEQQPAQEKENVCPNLAPEKAKPQHNTMKTGFIHDMPAKHSFPEEVSMCVYVPLLSEEEYRVQPDYMRRILGLDPFNRAIKKINQLLADRLNDEEKPFVTEDDLKEELDSSQLRVFFLSLMRIGYLSSKHNANGKPFYGPAHLL